MTNQRLVTLSLLLVFLISVFFLINEGLQKQKEQQKVVDELNATQRLADELKESFKESSHPLLEDEEIIQLLAYENRDASRVLIESSSSEVDRLADAASKVILEFSECASDGSHCGVNTDGWDEYFGMGAPPLHEAILRALSFIEVSKTEVDKELLYSLMKTPSFRVSFASASLALDLSDEPEEEQEVLKKSRDLQDKAKAQFLEKYANQATVDDLFIEEVSWAVNDKSDAYTRSEVLSRINNYNLDQEQFRFVAFQACQGVRVVDEEERRAKVINLLHRKSKDMGFSLSKNQLCSLPDESGEN